MPKFKCHPRMRQFVCLFVALLLFSPPLPVARAQGPATVATFAVLIQEIQGLIKDLESSARALIEQGNNALAQQQLLLAATLRGTISQVQAAYSSSLQKTYDALTVTEKNTFDNLKDLANEVQTQMKQGASDLIYQTQSAANQLLDRLPLTRREPILMGAKVKEFLGIEDQSDADISLLGYLLADPRLNYKKPDIKVNGENIPPDNVAWFYDRVNIQIPDAVKQKISFANKPCDPRKTFLIEVAVHYKREIAFSMGWESTANLTTKALAGRVAFEVTVIGQGRRTYTKPEPIAFATRSPYTSVGCNNAANTAVNFQMPAEGKNLNGHADWVETSNLKGQSANTVINNDVITATGTIVGLDEQGFLVKNCPGGGHAVLLLSGAYDVVKSYNEEYSYPQTATIAYSSANFSLPAEVPIERADKASFSNGGWLLNSIQVALFSISASVSTQTATASSAPSAGTGLVTVKYLTLTIQVRRKGCDKIVDQMVLNVPSDINQRVVQTSGQGKFKATYQRQTVEVALL